MIGRLFRLLLLLALVLFLLRLLLPGRRWQSLHRSVRDAAFWLLAAAGGLLLWQALDD